MKRPPDATEEEIEAAMVDCYAQLPITDYAGLACVVHRFLEHRFGPADD